MFIITWIGKLWQKLEASAWIVLSWAMAFNIFFGVAFYYAERDVQEGLTLVDSLWWSMVTMTTVGYGDFYAKTMIGRFLISYPCMILGIGIIGYLVGVVANAMLEWAARKRKGAMDINEKNHIILCNYPGEEKILTLIRQILASNTCDKPKFVLITETLDELPERLRKTGLMFVKGSPTDEDVLMRANILECNGVIVLAEDPHSLRSDDRTFAVGSIIEMIETERGIPIKTITELVGNRNIRNIERARVDGYVSAEDIGGCLLAQEFANPGISLVISQILSFEVGSELYICPTRLVGHSLLELQEAVLDNEVNLQIVGIINQGRQILNPDKKTRIQEGDKLIVLAQSFLDLNKIEQDFLKNAG